MKKHLTYFLLFFICTVTSAQTITVSKTQGKLFAMPGWDTSIERPTLGIDFAMAWTIDEVDRRGYEAGVKCDYSHVLDGIAGDRLDAGLFTTCELAGDLSLYISTGIGLYSKPWIWTHDKNNKYISTPVNCVIEFGPRYDLQLSDGNSAELRFSFVHNSNGWLAKPNMGLNYVQTAVGYRFDTRSAQHIHINDIYNHSGHFVLLACGAAVPGTHLATNKNLQPAYCIQTGYMKAYRESRAIGCSFDIGYNWAESYGPVVTGSHVPVPLTLGLCALYESYYGPVSVRTGIGWTIYKDIDCKNIYERVGIYYHMTNGNAVGFSVKAHVLRADFIEWGYNFSL